jgi:hypothetical protein
VEHLHFQYLNFDFRCQKSPRVISSNEEVQFPLALDEPLDKSLDEPLDSPLCQINSAIEFGQLGDEVFTSPLNDVPTVTIGINEQSNQDEEEVKLLLLGSTATSNSSPITWTKSGTCAVNSEHSYACSPVLDDLKQRIDYLQVS